jgi:hypothetical protein
MFFELIGTIVAGAAVGLMVWGLGRALRGRLPSWMAPVAAGVAMIAATISMEYGWASRTERTLPEGMIVAQSVEEASFWRPWTYLAPLTTRFVAVHRATMRTHPGQPGQRIVDLTFYGRWSRTSRIPVLFDCVGGRRADIADGVAFAEDGSVEGAAWLPLPDGDPILAAACEEVA